MKFSLSFETGKKKPERAAKPTAARIYAAARQTRLTSGWVTSTSSADTEIRSSLTSLRARGRSLTRDTPDGKRAKTLIVNNVIGTGMGLQAQVKSTRGKLIKGVNQSIEDAWEEWSYARYCHTGGEMCFADLERAVMGQIVEAGEVFLRVWMVPFGGSTIPFGLELIESERVPHEIQPPAGNTLGTVRMGVESDRFYRPLAYWIRSKHPSEISYDAHPESIERVEASSIIHLRVIERWPQTRGVPWFHAVATTLNDMDGYAEAEITAARGAANYTAHDETSDLDNPDIEVQPDGTYQETLEPGIVTRGPFKREFYAPNRPNSAFDPFMRSMQRRVAVGLNINYASFSGDYSQSNYSSSRLSLLDDRDVWQMIQSWIMRDFRDKVHRLWLQQAVLSGAVAIPVGDYMKDVRKYEAAKYKARGWGWINPKEEVDAYKEAVKAGFITRTQIISMTGGGRDIEDVDEERREELDNQAELDLEYDTDPGADEKAAAPAVPKEPEPDDDEPPGDEPAQDRKLRAIK